MIQSLDGELDVVRGDFPEGHFLREELPDQAVHVLVGATLPGSIGMGEVEVSPEFAGDALMLGELPAIVSRQGMNSGSERRQL